MALTNSGDGSFLLTAAHTITANLTAGAGTDALLKDSHSTGTVTITGGVTASATSRGIERSGAGQTDIVGDLTGGGSGKYGLYNNAAGTVNITGTCTGAISGSNGHGAINMVAGTMNIIGDVVGGAGSGGVSNGGAGTLIVDGNAYGSGTAGATNTSLGTVRVYGYATTTGASNGVNGLNVGGTTTVRALRFTLGASGSPITGYVKLEPVQGSNYVRITRSDSGTQDLSWDYPAEADVENGVGYALGTMEGTLVVATCSYPAEGDVEEGVVYGSGSEYTGTFGVPSEAQVEDGVGFGEDDTEFTGTLVAGSDWSDAEKQQIRKALGITGTTAATSGTGNLDEVLTDTGTTLPASFAALATDEDIADAVLGAAVEGSYTLEQLLQLMEGVLFGKASGGGTTTVTFRNLSDTGNRVVATVDSNGNRSAVTLTV